MNDVVHPQNWLKMLDADNIVPDTWLLVNNFSDGSNQPCHKYDILGHAGKSV